ncbi:MAG: hypothetical protein P8R43_04815, partial [Planctomycetota bacterium]|nr:hypothetical protein [Planctomycetota bacterium]
VLPSISMKSPWPAGGGLEVGAVIRGRTAHPDGSMTFRYKVGELEVEERIQPIEVTIQEGVTTAPGTRLGLERTFTVRAPVGTAVMARPVAARGFESLGVGRWSLDGGPWPVIELDAQSARLARIVDSVEGRDGPPAELRIPVPMLPEEPGSQTLVGTFSWRFAW